MSETGAVTFFVESNLVNALNFVIFDFFLISAVFHLSGELNGLFNDADLRGGEPRRLFLASPPIIGGGLCSTRRWRAAVLLAARFVGLALILLSNIAIKGDSPTVPRVANVSMVVPGPVRSFTPDELREAMLVRQGCTGTVNRALRPGDRNETVVYFGEIRDGACDVDLDLVYDKAVKFSQRVILVNVSSGNCTRYDFRESEPNESNVTRQVAQYWCEYARIQCTMEFDNPERVNLDTCRGIFFKDGVIYMADEGAVWPLMPEEPTHVRIVDGLDWRDAKWFDATIADRNRNAVADYIFAVYGAGRERREVTVMQSRSRTVIDPLWFVAFTLKVGLVIALFVARITLWQQGYRPVAHDEQRIAQLLRNRLEENDPRLTVHQSPENVPSIFINAQRDDNRRLQVYAAGRPGATPSQPGVSGDVTQEDSNFKLHEEEALHY